MGAPVYGAPWFFSFHISIGIIINVQKGKLWGGTFLACLIRVAYTGSVFTRGFIYNFNINSEEQRGSHFIVSISFLIFCFFQIFFPPKKVRGKAENKNKTSLFDKTYVLLRYSFVFGRNRSRSNGFGLFLVWGESFFPKFSPQNKVRGKAE